jgi:hypothetical protein
MGAAGAADASACSGVSRACGTYAPPAAYQYAPSPGPAYYGYGYGPPPAAYYAPPAYGYSSVRATEYYAPGPFFYGGRGARGCDRGYGYGNGYGNGYGYGYGFRPPVANGYAPAAVWVPIR